MVFPTSRRYAVEIGSTSPEASCNCSDLGNLSLFRRFSFSFPFLVFLLLLFPSLFQFILHVLSLVHVMARCLSLAVCFLSSVSFLTLLSPPPKTNMPICCFDVTCIYRLFTLDTERSCKMCMFRQLDSALLDDPSLTTYKVVTRCSPFPSANSVAFCVAV